MSNAAPAVGWVSVAGQSARKSQHAEQRFAAVVQQAPGMSNAEVVGELAVGAGAAVGEEVLQQRDLAGSACRLAGHGRGEVRRQHGGDVHLDAGDELAGTGPRTRPAARGRAGRRAAARSLAGLGEVAEAGHGRGEPCVGPATSRRAALHLAAVVAAGRQREQSGDDCAPRVAADRSCVTRVRVVAAEQLAGLDLASGGKSPRSVTAPSPASAANARTTPAV